MADKDEVRIIRIEQEGDVFYVSADVKSETRPNLYHHVSLIIIDRWIRFSCSCEAGTFKLMCKHVLKVYNKVAPQLQLVDVRR